MKEVYACFTHGETIWGKVVSFAWKTEGAWSVAEGLWSHHGDSGSSQQGGTIEPFS